MKYLLVLLLALTSCTLSQPPATPTALVLTATANTATPIPTWTLTLTPAPIVTVTSTPEPGGYRLPTVRPIPVGSVDVSAWLCHEQNYYWDVTPAGMTLHEDAVGERLCMGVKTL